MSSSHCRWSSQTDLRCRRGFRSVDAVEVRHRVEQHFVERDLRRPAEQGLRLYRTRHAAVAILVAFTVKLPAAHGYDRVLSEGRVAGDPCIRAAHAVRELPHGGLVAPVAD